MAAISVQGLTKRFGDVLAVDQLDFDVDPGTVTGFLGPNGAGKTTTLRMLLGLVAPTSGTATIGGRPYRELADPARRVGAVLEASGFHPGRTARDHLRVLVTAAGLDQGRVDLVLEQTGLAAAARRRVGGFSLGMRQRLGLAAALLGDPEVLVLDEPANGLDPEGVHWLRGLVRGLAAAVALFAVLGVGLAALLRNQVAAVIVGLLWWTQNVERLLVGVLHQPGLERWLPMGAASALTRPGDGTLPMWAGALVLAAYGLALALAGGRLVVRRDLT
jgi:ABC-type Na+ transport system ATPase subunit NatA